MLIIAIKAYRASHIESINKYSINKKNIITQINQKAEQIHN